MYMLSLGGGEVGIQKCLLPRVACIFLFFCYITSMEFRKIFDTIPEQFDKFRPRYSQELFDSLIAYAKIGSGIAFLLENNENPCKDG